MTRNDESGPVISSMPRRVTVLFATTASAA